MDGLLQVIRQRRLQSFPHPVLREELAGLRWTARAGILRPDHSASGHDDAVMAVALAVQAVVHAGPAFEGPLAEATFGRVTNQTPSPFASASQRLLYPSEVNAERFDPHSW